MRFIAHAEFPLEPFNTFIKDGSAGRRLQAVLEDCKPEAVYFVEDNGCRTAILVLDLKDASQLPSFAEPWFLQFNANIKFRAAMTPKDLRKAGLEGLGKKWG